MPACGGRCCSWSSRAGLLPHARSSCNSTISREPSATARFARMTGRRSRSRSPTRAATAPSSRTPVRSPTAARPSTRRSVIRSSPRTPSRRARASRTDTTAATTASGPGCPRETSCTASTAESPPPRRATAAASTWSIRSRMPAIRASASPTAPIAAVIAGFPSFNADILIQCTGGAVASQDACAHGCMSSGTMSVCYP